MTRATENFSIVHRLDADFSAEEDHELRRMLLGCFPYAASLLVCRYIREIPAHRWLARTASGELAGHVALHLKTIGISGGDLRIGGVAEVCVAGSYRGHGLAKRILEEAHAWMAAEGLPFALLFGQPKIYESSGYRMITNPISAENSMARHWNPFCGKPMVRKIGGQDWPAGPLDLRGPTF